MQVIGIVPHGTGKENKNVTGNGHVQKIGNGHVQKIRAGFEFCKFGYYQLIAITWTFFV